MLVFTHSTTLHLTALIYSSMSCHSLSIFSGTPGVKLLENSIRRLGTQVATSARHQIKTPQQLIGKAAEYLDPKVLDFF